MLLKLQPFSFALRRKMDLLCDAMMEVIFLMQLQLILMVLLLRRNCCFTNFKNVLSILFSKFELNGDYFWIKPPYFSFPGPVSLWIIAFNYWTVYYIINESTLFEGFFTYRNGPVNIDLSEELLEILEPADNGLCRNVWWMVRMFINMKIHQSVTCKVHKCLLLNPNLRQDN